MYNHIEGKISFITPAHVVVDCNGVGYFVHISLNTYTKLQKSVAEHQKLLLHLVVREDAMLLYGFFDEAERTLFRYLISVSGIGLSIAITMLSSMQPSDIIEAIIKKNVNTLHSVKGVGSKTAQRIIVELHDKLTKEQLVEGITSDIHNKNKQEALSALIVLGFSKMQTEKIVDKIIYENPDTSAEEIIRNVLKVL